MEKGLTFHQRIGLVVITAIVGGGLGAWFQHASWERRFEAELQNEQRQASVSAFTQLSMLLDRRLYWSRQLHWGFRNRRNANVLNDRWEQYRSVVFEWNEGLNAQRALLRAHFGDWAADWFDKGLTPQFVSLGQELEGFESRSPGRAAALADIENRIVALEACIYEFNNGLVEAVRDGTVGDRRSVGREWMGCDAEVEP